MQKFCRIAIAVSISFSSLLVNANDKKTEDLPIPTLAPEGQHATSSKRITAQFTRAHYKQVKMDDILSKQIFDRYIKQLDYARNVFTQADIDSFSKYQLDFDTVISRGKLNKAYEIYNLNLIRRLERYEYALSLLEKPFDFTIDESYNFDREDAAWPTDKAELDE